MLNFKSLISFTRPTLMYSSCQRSLKSTIHHGSRYPLAQMQPISYRYFHNLIRLSRRSTINIFEATSSVTSRNDKSTENTYQESRLGWWVVFGTITASSFMLWISSDTKLMCVEAAKPFYDEEEADKSIDIEQRNKTNEVDDFKPTKKKKSKRDRYNFISDVVESVGDTVVCIEIKDHASVDWLTGVPQTASHGSGFIISSDGLILTNAHVVAPRKKSSISVRLRDGRTFAASIEEIDFESDLAIIRIHSKNLPVMPLGSSAETKIGEWVVALGSPLSLTNTITAGVVSSVRGASELGIHSNDINYIQTDAAINFGNSGGPLINLDGEAIGINSMKVTDGISFAIPIDYAKTFLAKAEARQSKGQKKLARRYLGITTLTVTDQIRRELATRSGFTNISSGVLVWQVVVGAPAYLAGIQPGDIIVRVNNKPITSSGDLHEVVNVEDKLHIQVQRGTQLFSCVIVPELVGVGEDSN